MLERLLEADGRKKGYDATRQWDYQYFAPEMIENSTFKTTQMHPYAHDVWALGVILYEKVAGWMPFEGKTAEEYLKNVADPEVKYAEIPEHCKLAEARLISQMLEKDPAKRANAELLY